MSEHQLSKAGVNDITDAVQQLLQKILTDLRGSATKQAADEPRLFFPHGIELISVVVKIGPADVEVTIAGEKGVKSAAVASGLGNSLLGTSSMDVDDDVNKNAICRGDQLTWYNYGNQPVHIVFDVGGCPLNVCDFTVPKAKGTTPGTYLTLVLRTVDSGTYDFHRSPGRIPSANPKIIIQ